MNLSTFPNNCASRVLSGWDGSYATVEAFVADVKKLILRDSRENGRMAFIHAVFTEDQLDDYVLRRGLEELDFREVARRINPKTGSMNVVFIWVRKGNK